MSQVPTAPASGTEGSQAVGTAIIPTTLAPPMQLQPSSVPDAIDGLVATHSRNLGGDVAARLLAGSMRDTSNQLAAAHETIAENARELKAANGVITDLRVELAGLKARLAAAVGTNQTSQVTTFIGTALLGVAVDLYKDGQIVIASLLGIFGLGLLVVAARSARRGKNP